MGTLFIVSTPIGNLTDITIRAIQTLLSVDLVACEDTRRTGQLLTQLQSRYGQYLNSSQKLVRPKLVSFYDEIENQRVPEILQALQSGCNVALVSDAGTPLISDPGYRLVCACLKLGIKVTSIPGPTALIAALTGSGLPSSNFFFLSYPPEKPSHRLELFRKLRQMNQLIVSTYIMYCAPHKLRQTLKDMLQIFGDGNVCLARELTKIHEEIWRGKFSEAVEHFTEPRGEFVILWSLGSN